MSHSHRPKILLFGKHGQVGAILSNCLQSLGQTIALGRSDCDLRETDTIGDTINAERPDIIINAAAYNAVDQAESESDTAYAINAVAPQVMAQYAATYNALLIHYSSDFVFDGKKGAPYIESNEPNPLSIYGKSKWKGEQAISQTCAKHLIFRTSWLYSLGRSNFLLSILKAATQHTAIDVVSDQIGTPTSAHLVSSVTTKVLRQYIMTGSLPYGIYHLCSNGGVSRYEYAKTIVMLARRHPQLLIQATEQSINPTYTNQLSNPAPRPKDSRLNNRKLQHTFNLQLPTWQKDLKDTIQIIAEHCHD